MKDAFVRECEARLDRARERLKHADKLRFAERGPTDTGWRDVTADRIQDIKDEIATYEGVLKGLARP